VTDLSHVDDDRYAGPPREQGISKNTPGYRRFTRIFPGCYHHWGRVVRHLLGSCASARSAKSSFFSGIGLESCLLFAAEGANVILADINLAAAEKAVAIITSQSPNAKAIALRADVGKESDVKELVERAVETFGRLDVMVSVRVACGSETIEHRW
jgi:hypothetical protein